MAGELMDDLMHAIAIGTLSFGKVPIDQLIERLCDLIEAGVAKEGHPFGACLWMGEQPKEAKETARLTTQLVERRGQEQGDGAMTRLGSRGHFDGQRGQVATRQAAQEIGGGTATLF